MTPDEDPYESFKVGEWHVDYRDRDADEVVSELREDWRRELLLQDYEQASEDGRHRNQLVHYSFYIGLVVLGLILNVGWQMWRDGEFAFLVTLLVFGAGLHGLLYVWATSAKNSRDACWDRRSEIEDLVKLADEGLLRSNDGVFKRLTRETDGEYSLPGKEGVERLSVGERIVEMNAVVSAAMVLGTLLLVSAAAFGTLP
jgi:hypothetical protein